MHYWGRWLKVNLYYVTDYVSFISSGRTRHAELRAQVLRQVSTYYTYTLTTINNEQIKIH